MAKQDKTEGKTSTESVGVTETQISTKYCIDYVAYEDSEQATRDLEVTA